MKNNKYYIEQHTDKYFSSTKKIMENEDHTEVVYCFFLRKKSIYSLKIAIDFIKEVCQSMNYKITLYENFKEGDIVEKNEPLFFLKGSFVQLSELETLILQKVGLSCLCAWNTYSMSKLLPNVGFISMLSRHCVNKSMVYACEYGASVGSQAARREGATGFIGCSNDANSYLFNMEYGMGTMPHSLVGYAKSTLEAAILYNKTFPNFPMTVLVDYFGTEIKDSIEVCNYFKEMAQKGDLSLRIDTHSKRYLETLDEETSYNIIKKHAPLSLESCKTKEELQYLLGPGVSVAATFHMREKLDQAGFNKVNLVVSSGFNVNKCKVFSLAKAPISKIGTGSYIPNNWVDTYTTADIISYNGRLSVKKGREHLIKQWEKTINKKS